MALLRKEIGHFHEKKELPLDTRWAWAGEGGLGLTCVPASHLWRLGPGHVSVCVHVRVYALVPMYVRVCVCLRAHPLAVSTGQKGRGASPESWPCVVRQGSEGGTTVSGPWVCVSHL